jgi:fibronectin type III domain protein/flagellar hook capping protein FlgD
LLTGVLPTSLSMTIFSIGGSMQLQRTIRAIGWPQLVIAAAMIFSPFISATAGGLESSEATTRSVTLRWTAVGDDGLAGAATTYDIRYSTSTITENNFDAATRVVDTPAPLPAGFPESFEVTGLEPSTEYFFAIKVGDDADNWSGLSNVMSRATASALSAVLDFDAQTGTEEGRIDLSWTDSPEITDLVTPRRYLVRYSETAISSGDLATVPIVDTSLAPPAAGQPQRLTISGLMPDQRYYLVAQAYDGFDGLSPLSNYDSAVASSDIATGIDDGASDGLPQAFELHQNYPNPFNPTTTIEYVLPRQMHVSVNVYNTLGRRVALLVDAMQPAGYHRVEWDASDDFGVRVASGVYLYRIVAGEIVESRKMVLLKYSGSNSRTGKIRKAAGLGPAA